MVAAGSNASGFARIVVLITSLLKILVWPLRIVLNFLFPIHELDGLAPAVSAKASEQFVSYLNSLSRTAESSAVIRSTWSTVAFTTLQAELLTDPKLLIIYLHSPLHSCSRTFCTNVLNGDRFLAFCQDESVLTLGLSIHSAQGAQLQSILSVTSFPAIVVLEASESRRSLAISYKAQGHVACSNASLMNALLHVHQQHAVKLAAFHADRREREERARLRAEQDEAYTATLAEDKKREEERMQRELDAAEEVERIAQAERMEQEAAAQEMDNARALILPEPASGGAKIRFRLPNGLALNRTFESTQTVAALKAYLKVHFLEHGIEMGTIGLSTSYPRQTFNEPEDESKTLEDAKLSPQAMLMVQDLDA